MIKSVKLDSVSRLAFLFAAGFVCVIAVFFFVKWCLANPLAARAPAKEIAELAVALAPNDPQTHYALAVLGEKNFAAADLSESLREFEAATALAPHDFRLWLALGKARERRGDQTGAELALKKALTLAPHYAPIQWTLGNVLLRGGKTEEAFAQMRLAAENDETYRAPTVLTAWQISGGDIGAIKKHVGDSAHLNSALAVFLAKQKRLDEAIEIWNAFRQSVEANTENIKAIYKAEGAELFNELIQAKRFRDARLVQIGFSNEREANVIPSGAIANGGFEAEVKREQAGVFEWQIGDGAQPQIGFDDREKAGGQRSLVIVFNSADGKDFRQISQTTAINAAGKYTFEMFYKSNLKTAAALRWEIVDAATGAILATTDSISNAADWTNARTEFVVPEQTQAVTVRLARQPCKSTVCPTTGKVWFDDFSIRQ